MKESECCAPNAQDSTVRVSEWKMVLFHALSVAKHRISTQYAIVTKYNIVDFEGRRGGEREHKPREKVLNFKLRKWEMYKRISMNYYYCHYIKYTHPHYGARALSLDTFR